MRFLQLGSGSELVLEADLPEGIYNLAVLGQWPDGDISYGFRIEVSPG